MKRRLPLILLLSLGFAATAPAETRTPTNGLPAASECQQKAIADLVAAFKELQKVMADAKEAKKKESQGGGGGGDKKEKDVFEDKQAYKKPPLDKESNPENQLADLVEQEKQIVDALNKPTDPQDGQTEPEPGQPAPSGEPAPGGKPQVPGNGTPSLSGLARKQGEIAAKLDAMQKNPALPAPTSEKLARAAGQAATAKQAMESGAAKESDLAAEKTLAAMQQALTDIRARSEQNTGASLESAQKDLNGADRTLSEAGDPARVAQEMQEALDRIAAEVEKQHDGGTQEAAEKLAALAAKLDAKAPRTELKALGDTNALAQAGAGTTNGASGAVAQKLGEMRKAVAEARGAGMLDAAEMAGKIEQLEQLAEAMEKAAAAGPGNKEAAAQLEALMADAELQMQDLLAAVARAKPEISANLNVLLKAMPEDGTGPGGRGKSDPKSRSGSGGSGGRGATNEVPPTAKPPESPEAEHLESLIRGARRVLMLARENLPKAERVPWIRAYSPDEVPEAYRRDVAAYFEALSEAEQPKQKDGGK